MKLEEIYHRCGLKEPEEYRREFLARVLFSGDSFFQREVIEGGRQLGKTTNFMIRGIQNLFDGRSTLILTYSSTRIIYNDHLFEKYLPLFPELLIEREGPGQFIANPHSSIRVRLRFLGVHNRITGITQSDIPNRFEWDEIFDDST